MDGWYELCDAYLGSSKRGVFVDCICAFQKTKPYRGSEAALTCFSFFFLFLSEALAKAVLWKTLQKNEVKTYLK